MKIILETPETPSEPLFRDVETDQFFVDIDGHLCQKVTGNKYNPVATNEGFPYAKATIVAPLNLKIGRILPKVAKIEF